MLAWVVLGRMGRRQLPETSGRQWVSGGVMMPAAQSLGTPTCSPRGGLE